MYREFLMENNGDVSVNLLDKISSIFTTDISEMYPGAVEWFSKVREELLTTGDRHLVAFTGGFAILKPSELKICTMWVYEEYRGYRNSNSITVLRELTAQSMLVMNTRRVNMTVPVELYMYYTRMLSDYTVTVTDKITGMYRPGKVEYLLTIDF